MKQTRIVAIHPKALEIVTNLNHLPCYLEGGNYHMVFHSAPRVDLEGDRVTRNFDLVINREHDPRIDPAHQVVLDREGKHIQTAVLNRTISNGDYRFFQPTKGYLIDVDDIKASPRSGNINNPLDYCFGVEHPRFVVLKPNHGARGVSQFLINTTHHSPVDVLSHIYHEASSYEEVVDAFTGVYGTPSPLAHDDAFLNGANYFLQEYVDTIEAEYQVLFYQDCKGEVYGYVLGRERSDNNGDFVQINRNFRPMSHQGQPYTPRIEEYFNAQMVSELKSIIQATGLMLGSIDLYYNWSNCRYGIFEYCPQFGSITESNRWYRDFHRRAIETWLDNALSK